MNLKIISKEDNVYDFPEQFNGNMKEIEKAMNNIMFEIARLKDDVAHLKLMIRED